MRDNIPNIYAREMQNEFALDIIFPPTGNVQLGDYGTTTRPGVLYGATPTPFQRRGNIREFGIKFKTRQKSALGVESLVSRGVSIKSGRTSGSALVGEGTVLIGFAAFAKITFGRSESVVYHGSDMRELAIEQTAELTHDLENLEIDGSLTGLLWCQCMKPQVSLSWCLTASMPLSHSVGKRPWSQET
jgi:hypothetical protein